MAKAVPHTLTRRERQIMDILYRRGRATAGEAVEDLPGSPTYSTVRAQLRVLEDKGHVQHNEVGLRYVYTPIVPRNAVRQSALRHIVDTFFDGSTTKSSPRSSAQKSSNVSDEELDRITDLVEKARKGRRK